MVELRYFGAKHRVWGLHATIVQPEGYNGLKCAHVFARLDISLPTRNASACSWIGLN
jgi:hypothetical protein